MDIHEHIRLMREEQRLTQEEMADKLNMSTSGYAKIERGETKLYHEKLEKIADVFGVSVNQLLASKSEKIVVCMNENTDCNNNTLFYGQSDVEIERLKLIVKHKEELLLQKDKELQALNEIIHLLQEKSSL